MKKNLTIIIGIGLVIFGGLALAANLLMPVLGFTFRWWQIYRFWPLAVISIGVLLSVIPLLAKGKKAVGIFFIFGLPILVTGAILLFSSLFDAWWVWSYLWPLEVLSVAMGFASAAIYARLPALGVPAILIGLNGILLQFCALTGWWTIWRFMWVIEPLAVGLSLLLLSWRRHSPRIFTAGLLFCGFAVLALAASASIALTGWWVIRYLSPIALIFIGAVILFWSIFPKRSLPAKTA